MNPLFNKIALALQERLDVIADHELRDRDAATHLKKLQEASETIESCAAALPIDTPARLRHFLEHRSYDKALDWIKKYSPTK